MHSRNEKRVFCSHKQIDIILLNDIWRASFKSYYQNMVDITFMTLICEILQV